MYISAHQVTGSIPQVVSELFLKMFQSGIRSPGKQILKIPIPTGRNLIVTFVVVISEPSSTAQHVKGPASVDE